MLPSTRAHALWKALVAQASQIFHPRRLPVRFGLVAGRLRQLELRVHFFLNESNQAFTSASRIFKSGFL